MSASKRYQLEQHEAEMVRDLVEADYPPTENIADDLGEYGGLTSTSIRIVAEKAYRRGFTQGVAAAIRAGNKPQRELDAWLNRLMQWRLEPHGGQSKFPEEI